MHLRGDKLKEQTTLEKGAALEQQIAAYFRINGYDADLNAKLEGKSGAIHEIDVLVHKSDGITDFTLAVECKAWETPIEKSVVSKLSMVISDIGINKGLIVSLQGWRSGAEKSARQERIELWGPDELSQRLGAVALAELHSRQRNQYAVQAVREISVPMDKLEQTLASQAKGPLGTSREEIVWSELVWVPFHLVELRYSTVVKEFLRKPTTKVTPAWSMYNALDDTYFWTQPDRPDCTDRQVDLVIAAKTKPLALGKTLVATVTKANEVRTANARDRYLAKLYDMEIRQNLESLSAGNITTVHYPFLVGLLRRRGQERLVAINAFNGKLDEAVSKTLTENLAYVCQSIGK
jgi:hypothetical protein